MTTNLVPAIPEDAPFSPAQRAWLNGYLAGLYSYAPAQMDDLQPTALAITVLYGSQTGTAEGLARKFSKELKSAGHSVTLCSLEGYVPAALASQKYALFIVSTYGEGEAPDSVQPFYQQLCVEHFPLLGDVAYSVLALGDSHYEHFCQFGKDLDMKLSALGATRILDRTDCDVDVYGPYLAWKQSIVRRLEEIGPPRSISDSIVATDERTSVIGPASASAKQDTPHHTREKPYLSALAEKRPLTHPSSTKLTIHLDFSIDESAVQYVAGDACGVVPQNDSALVDEVLNLLPFSGDEQIEILKGGSATLRDALLHQFSVTRLTRKMVAEYAALAQCTRLGALLAPAHQTELEQYMYGRDLVDLLRECPGVLNNPDDLVKMLPRLSPRLYSISSSPAAHPGRVHTTVSVVKYRSHDRDRGGVCSTLLSDRMSVGDRLPIYIQPNKKFRLPQDSSAPIIMIGPGTGIAPFRGFLHERRATGATGRNWLFFGERSAATDFLYREELEAMVSDGHLTQLDTAFSRDQTHKVYVQDLMKRKAAQLWSWLQQGAYLYVCGDGSRMAKDVDRAIHQIIECEGKMPQEEAEAFMQALKDDHRYERDVY